jgi:hypothetical protein
MAAPARLTALLAVSALAVTACGQTTKSSAGNFRGEQRAVAQAVDDLQSAGSKGDAGKICSQLLTPGLVAKIRQASNGACDTALKDSLSDVDRNAFGLEVKKVTINGTDATAVVRATGGSDHRTETLGLQKVGGAWKIATLGAQ